jgi:RNA polymerase sigma-70 factor (ECF subfamily)
VEDERVMQEVRAGDVAKLEVLFDRHHVGLFRYFLSLTANRATSEDLAQEVFFRVLKYRHTYQPGAGFRPWLYSVGRNVWADHMGRRKPEVTLPEKSGEIRGKETPPDRAFQKKQEALFLRRALASLPGEKREVLILSRYQDMKYEEIASVLQCEVGAVKVRVYRALRELSDRFLALTGERAS